MPPMSCSGRPFFALVLSFVSFSGVLSAQVYLFNRADFPVGNLPTAVVSADFNRDHLTDVAVVNGSDNTLSILLGKPNGAFASQLTFPTGSGPSSIAAGDLDGVVDRRQLVLGKLDVERRADDLSHAAGVRGGGRVGGGGGHGHTALHSSFPRSAWERTS